MDYGHPHQSAWVHPCVNLIRSLTTSVCVRVRESESEREDLPNMARSRKAMKTNLEEAFSVVFLECFVASTQVGQSVYL